MTRASEMTTKPKSPAERAAERIYDSIWTFGETGRLSRQRLKPDMAAIIAEEYAPLVEESRKLRALLHRFAYEPIGRPYATVVEILAAITDEARAALGSEGGAK